MHRFQIIPVWVRTAAAGDILVATHGNFSVLRPPKVLVEVDIRLPPLVNSSNLDISGHARISVSAGALNNIVLPALTNNSVLGSGSPFAAFPVVQEAPPDGNIRLPAISNSSVLEGGSPLAALVVVNEAPPTGFIRLPSLTNSSVLTVGSPAQASITVNPSGFAPFVGEDEDDSMIGDGTVAGRMV